MAMTKTIGDDLPNVTVEPKPAHNDRAAPIRIMIIDDLLIMRIAFARMLETENDCDVVAKLGSAEMALDQIETLRPDVVLLDLQMAGMDGLDALPLLLDKMPQLQVLVVSSLTERGAQATMSALALGAADTLPKPQNSGFVEEFQLTLLEKVRTLGRSAGRCPAPASPPRKGAARRLLNRLAPRPVIKPEVLGIGASTGGIHALTLFLKNLPRSIDVPILVTQHLPDSFMPVFARQLASAGERPAMIAENGMTIRRGRIYVAPGEGHLTLVGAGATMRAAIISGKVQTGCMPSVDPMFHSLADFMGSRAIGIVLSGMGQDGMAGAAALRAAGGAIYAQNAETCAVWGMPRAVTEAGIASIIASPQQLAARIAASLEPSAWK